MFPEWKLDSNFLMTHFFQARALDAKLSSHPIEVECPDANMVNQVWEFFRFLGSVRLTNILRRKIFDQLNLVNRNEQTVEIAQRTLSAICHAVGQVHVSDSEQLHFKPLIVTLKVKPAGNDKSGIYREARNEVAGYSAASAGASGGVAPRPAAAVPRAPQLIGHAMPQRAWWRACAAASDAG